jgi:hypothetical protein
VSEKLTIRKGQVITRRVFDFRYPWHLQFFDPMANRLGGTLLSKDGKSAAVYGHYYLVNASSSRAVQKAAWQLCWYFSSHVEEMLDQVGLIIPSKKLLGPPV